MGLAPPRYRATLPCATTLTLSILLLGAAEASPRARFSDAEYARHVVALKKKLPHDGFTVVIEKPFVVIGDDRPREVRRRARRTVRWAVAQLRSLYFDKEPDTIIDVWLFKDARSYERHTKILFGDTPSTPYGYYSPSENALIMNIATGGGTLVHEIVHPFIAANFPRCPDWFNEGLGSLYEHSGVRDGRIVGLTNWRLDGLQQAILHGELPSFRRLTSNPRFYGDDPGTNYAQARYLLQYLQERGLLVSYYKTFRANRGRDPTGYRTLKRALGGPDMKLFEARWKKWVLGLSN